MKTIGYIGFEHLRGKTYRQHTHTHTQKKKTLKDRERRRGKRDSERQRLNNKNRLAVNLTAHTGKHALKKRDSRSQLFSGRRLAAFIIMLIGVEGGDWLKN